MKLYWVETPDHHEDWFVVARNPREARAFFENAEGYDGGGSTCRLVLEVPDHLPSRTTAPPATGNLEHQCFVGWPTDDLIRACGGEFLPPGEPRLVRFGKELFCEGLLEHEIQLQQRQRHPRPPRTEA
ncbi:MAG: hypothetical protein ACT4TC_08155 [Myxococcaceae bacterium]